MAIIIFLFTESQEAIYRKNLTLSQRSVFPSDKTLLKTLYLSTLQATGKWTQPIRNWGKAYGEFSVIYEGSMPL